VVREFADQPEMLATIGVYLQSVLEQQFGRAADFIETGERWLPDWQDAATFSDFGLRLDPAGLRALVAELQSVVDRYRDAEPVAGAETIHVQLQAFPYGPGGQA